MQRKRLFFVDVNLVGQEEELPIKFHYSYWLKQFYNYASKRSYVKIVSLVPEGSLKKSKNTMYDDFSFFVSRDNNFTFYNFDKKQIIFEYRTLNPFSEEYIEDYFNELKKLGGYTFVVFGFGKDVFYFTRHLLDLKFKIILLKDLCYLEDNKTIREQLFEALRLKGAFFQKASDFFESLLLA